MGKLSFLKIREGRGGSRETNGGNLHLVIYSANRRGMTMTTWLPVTTSQIDCHKTETRWGIA
jgi:hypothetical protein